MGGDIQAHRLGFGAMRLTGAGSWVGCTSLLIEAQARICRIGSHTFNEDDWLTLDGNAGRIFAGHLNTVSERPDPGLAIIRTWAATSPSAARTSSLPGASARRTPQSAP